MAGRGCAGSGRMRPRWPHGHGSYLPRSGLWDAGEPRARHAGSGRLGTAGGGPVIPLSTGGAGAEQAWCGVTARSPARRGPGRDPAAPQVAGPARGGPGPARDEAVTQVSARCAGPVTCLPPARPRPAAMCQPVAVVRLAGMTIVVVPAGSAACPALPWQASAAARSRIAVTVGDPTVETRVPLAAHAAGNHHREPVSAGGLDRRLHGVPGTPVPARPGLGFPADFNAQLACWLARADTRRHRAPAGARGSAPARPR